MHSESQEESRSGAGPVGLGESLGVNGVGGIGDLGQRGDLL